MQKQSQKINEPAIAVKNLTVVFDDNVVLKNLTFNIEQGTITAIIGPNGSGKTTLLRAILGLEKIQTGQIKIMGQPLHHVRRAIGYVPQRFQFDKTFPITAMEFMKLAQHKESSDDQIRRAIKDVGLKPQILKKQLGILSGGQLQRILMAQATINDPAILILDEPAAGVDMAGEAAFYDIVHHLKQEHGTTVVLVSHDVSMVSKHVDQVLCINQKLLCAGTPQKTLTDKQISKMFGGHSHLFEHRNH